MTNMIENKFPGKFIVIEGLDGSGSSTQATKLLHNLKGLGKEAYLTKEPTDSLVGGLIRSRLKNEWSTSSECLQLLFTADRAHHLHTEIIPLLKDGAFVVCDRYFLSTLAYGALDMDMDWLVEMNDKFIIPDLSLLVDVPPKVCLERIGEDRFDFELFEKEQELIEVRKNYKNLFDKFEDIILINGEGDEEKISSRIFSEVRNKLL